MIIFGFCGDQQIGGYTVYYSTITQEQIDRLTEKVKRAVRRRFVVDEDTWEVIQKVPGVAANPLDCGACTYALRVKYLSYKKP